MQTPLPTGPYVDSDGNSLTRNITNLEPGKNYLFVVYAHNGAAENGGFSDPSDSAAIQQLGGAWIRSGGTFYRAVPYVRDGGEWKEATLFVRDGGVWKETD